MTYTIEQLPIVWQEFSNQLFNYISTDIEELQIALRDTYELFYRYKNEKNVPKEFCEIVYNMRNYIYYIETEEDLPIMDYAVEITTVIYAVLDGFMENNYQCEFPVLKIQRYIPKAKLFNMEEDDLFDLLEELYADVKEHDKNFFKKSEKKDN